MLLRDVMNSLKRTFLSFYLMGTLSDRAKNREQSLDKVKSMTLEPECLTSALDCHFLTISFFFHLCCGGDAMKIVSYL